MVVVVVVVVEGGPLFVCLLLEHSASPAACQLYLRDGSAKTVCTCCRNEMETAD